MQRTLWTVVLSGMLAALSGCVVASGTLVGDVEITTQAEADALAGVTRILGSLSVRPVEPVVTLPALQKVIGNVLIEVDPTAPGMFMPAEQVVLPVLHSVAGTLSFHHLGGAYGADVQIGLPMLTSLPGDLELVLSSFNGYNKGLQAVTTVGGNINIQATGDFYPSGMLDALTSVNGNLTIHANAGSSGNILRTLQHVGGNLALESLGRQTNGVLDMLQSVGGDFSVLNSYWTAPHYPMLESVEGTFSVDGVTGAGPLPNDALAGGATLTIGALALRQTGFSRVPLTAGVTVSATGAITVEDNSSMCPASVDDFVDAQQLAGWTGTLSVSGNTGSCGP